MRLLISGASGGTNVGDSFRHAAATLGIPAELMDMQAAWRAPVWRQKLHWHLLGGRPPGVQAYSDRLLAEARRSATTHVLSTGFAPISPDTIRRLRELGIRTLNFLTDDPWSRMMRGKWSLASLVEYDVIFTPRRANLADLQAAGAREVRYLPFGFDPRHFYPEPVDPELQVDVLYVGGGDRDRAPWIGALRRAGFSLALYGRYWDRYPESRGLSFGMASPERIRQATASARIALCLVKRANRDGHVMRSLEIPRTKACMLAEDTAEHRELFGPEGECAVYFQTPDELVRKARQLLADDALRQRLASQALVRISEDRHSYAARLKEMLQIG